MQLSVAPESNNVVAFVLPTTVLYIDVSMSLRCIDNISLCASCVALVITVSLLVFGPMTISVVLAIFGRSGPKTFLVVWASCWCSVLEITKFSSGGIPGSVSILVFFHLCEYSSHSCELSS